ncbi:MAG: [citrate (pro-3S)-lyase] ligase [Treponema sp.]|nr:[citrate (pro-3S)-lyase] ligase [Treponema sp.]
MEIEYAYPPKGRQLERVRTFLGALGLGWDEGSQFTVNLTENGRMLASGSRQNNVLKCIGVAADHQGEGLTASIVTELVKDALYQGFSHCFLFTKPENITRFEGLGFWLIAETADAALLENRKNGVPAFVDALGPVDHLARGGKRGAVVAHCNPFTKGHLYLIEEAARRCSSLDLFILSEPGGVFPPGVRMELAIRGTAHLATVQVHPTGAYLISSVTFPEYFIQDRDRVPEIHAELDITIFAQYFAKPRFIVHRFIGTEPHSRLTAMYNQRLQALLPPRGIEVIEIPRLEAGGAAISASRVRDLLRQSRLEDIRPLVPDSTYEYLSQGTGKG